MEFFLRGGQDCGLVQHHSRRFHDHHVRKSRDGRERIHSAICRLNVAWLTGNVETTLRTRLWSFVKTPVFPEQLTETLSLSTSGD